MKRRANAAYVHKDPDVWKFEGSTSVPNSITRDPDIPPDECWAWTWLSSHTEEFEVSGEKLWKAKNGLSKRRAYELLSALERRGLLLRYHAFDHDERVPYIDYQLQPRPVPEDQRTWRPSRAKPRCRSPHPGSRAAEQARERETAALIQAARAESEAAPQGWAPDRAGIPSELDFSDRAGTRVDSRPAGNRPGGNPYMEQKTTSEDQNPLSPSGPAPAEGERGRTSPPTDHPTPQAMDVILSLRWPGPKDLSRVHALELATLVDAAVTSGYTWDEIARHAAATLKLARSNPVHFLRTGLRMDQLPVRRPARLPAQRVPDPSDNAQPACDSDRIAAIRAAAGMPRGDHYAARATSGMAPRRRTATELPDRELIGAST